MPQVSRDVLISVLSTDNGRREDRIGWRETCGDGQGGKEVELRNEGVNEPRGDEPALDAKKATESE